MALHERDSEFWKQSRTCLAMAARLKETEGLIRQIRGEPAIPDQVRDNVIVPLERDHASNISLFREFMANFINTASLGLHRLDVEIDAGFIPPGMIEIDRCAIRIDGHAVEIPGGIGHSFFEAILSGYSYRDICARILSYYKDAESRFDRIMEGDINRCTLRLFEEIYPRASVVAVIRLPAVVLVDAGVV